MPEPPRSSGVTKVTVYTLRRDDPGEELVQAITGKAFCAAERVEELKELPGVLVYVFDRRKYEVAMRELERQEEAGRNDNYPGPWGE